MAAPPSPVVATLVPDNLSSGQFPLSALMVSVWNVKPPNTPAATATEKFMFLFGPYTDLQTPPVGSTVNVALLSKNLNEVMFGSVPTNPSYDSSQGRLFGLVPPGTVSTPLWIQTSPFTHGWVFLALVILPITAWRVFLMTSASNSPSMTNLHSILKKPNASLNVNGSNLQVILLLLDLSSLAGALPPTAPSISSAASAVNANFAKARMGMHLSSKASAYRDRPHWNARAAVHRRPQMPPFANESLPGSIPGPQTRLPTAAAASLQLSGRVTDTTSTSAGHLHHTPSCGAMRAVSRSLLLGCHPAAPPAQRTRHIDVARARRSASSSRAKRSSAGSNIVCSDARTASTSSV